MAILTWNECAARVCKLARFKADVTQSEMSRELKCCVENIRKFERGDNNNLAYFLLYMEKFNINYEDVRKEIERNGYR